MTRRNTVIIIAFAVALVVILTIFLVALRGRPVMRGRGTATTTTSTTSTTTTTTTPRAQGECPLTGERETGTPLAVPLAVSIDNISQARPQSGLDKADIVYEVSAEARIPRFLAIYYCKSAERIGPVRSARPYFNSLAKQFNAVMVHAGGSPQALEEIRRGEIRSLDQFRFPRAYERDRRRRAPHNLFTSTSELLDAAEEAGFRSPSRITGPRFNGDPDAGIEARTVVVPFAATTVTYSFDPDSGTYLRSMNGQPHRDAVTNNQLRAANVIIQFTQQRVTDRAGRRDIDLVGSGEASFFINGKRINGRWVRSTESQPFRYEDANGNEIRFKRGQIWVEIVQEGTLVP